MGDNLLATGAISKLRRQQTELRNRLETADERGDSIDYMYLEEKYRTVSMALADMMAARQKTG